MANLESDEFGKQEDVSGSGKCCPTCGRSGPTQGRPTEMMRGVDPMSMMSKLQTRCVTVHGDCFAHTVNAIQGLHDPSTGRLGAADALAQALRLDMANWWHPTASNLFRTDQEGANWGAPDDNQACWRAKNWTQRNPRAGRVERQRMREPPLLSGALGRAHSLAERSFSEAAPCHNGSRRLGT